MPRAMLILCLVAAVVSPVRGTEAPGDGVGGVGIAFVPNADGELEVKAILPGGPADRAKLKPGGILVAVDGKDVDEMSPEQVRALIAGKPGTLVKLTIETEDEVMDVLLERAVLHPQGPASAEPAVEPRDRMQPGVTPPGGAMPGGGAPAPELRPGDLPQVGGFLPQVNPDRQRGGEFPAWMKPGVRVTWYLGSASIPGMSQTAVQDDNGNWIDPVTGKRYANVDNPSTGGAGLLQFDILQASNNFVAVAARNWLLLDPQGGNLTAGPSQGYFGDSRALSDFWVNPAMLASLQEQDQGGLRIRRLVYPLNGRNYNAIVISNTAGGGFMRTTYDLETGLLLVGSSRTAGAAQKQIGPQGQVYTGAGVTTITSTMLQDVRELRLPWAGDPVPPFVRQGWSVQYQGGQSTAIPGAEGMNIPPNPITIVGTVERSDQYAVTMKVQSRMDSAYGAGQASEVVRCYGSGMIGGLWINPRVLGQLQPGAVLDEDRLTRVRTTFGGVQNNMAGISEQGPMDATIYYYDLQSGLLVGVASQQRSGVATITTQLQLTGQR